MSQSSAGVVKEANGRMERKLEVGSSCFLVFLSTNWSTFSEYGRVASGQNLLAGAKRRFRYRRLLVLLRYTAIQKTASNTANLITWFVPGLETKPYMRRHSQVGLPRRDYAI